MSGKLAILGGKPSVPNQLVEHDWERYRKSTQEEIDAVVDVLKSGHLSIAAGKGMPQAEALEREFAEWTGAKYCLAVSHGTAALHCAIAGAGVEAGDEVLVPAYTFIATAMAVLHQNAVPVFVDVDPETCLIDVRKIENHIGERTRAIMPVHIYGLPADMDPIHKIAQKRGLKVIEDSAQGYGAGYRGKKAGNLGDAAGFAMTTTKQLMVGEGGLMTTSSEEIYEKASMLRLFGERGDMKAADRAYLSETVGWNYKLVETSSALARVKLKHLDDYVAKTVNNCDLLTRKLQPLKGIKIPKLPPFKQHAWYLYPVIVAPEQLELDMETGKVRNALLQALTAENVKVLLWQKVPVPAQPMFQTRSAFGKGSPWILGDGDRIYSIDEYPNAFDACENHFLVKGLVPPNGNEVVERYAEAFEKVLSNLEQVLDIYEKSGSYVPLKQRMDGLRSSP